MRLVIFDTYEYLLFSLQQTQLVGKIQNYVDQFDMALTWVNHVPKHSLRDTP